MLRRHRNDLDASETGKGALQTLHKCVWKGVDYQCEILRRVHDK